jgi:mannitol-1-phosphate 5-dehydrogenase
MSDRTFVGFGFGAIQAGLFLFEAYYSRNFKRLIVAEVMDDVVAAVRKSGGKYRVNVAMPNGIEQHEIKGIEIFNPKVAEDRKVLIQAIAEAAEITTALPSVKFYGTGQEGDVVDILGRGLKQKLENRKLPAAVIYTGENHNHAAEIMDEALAKGPGIKGGDRYQSLNTVIGKMSGVVVDPKQMQEQKLACVVEGMSRAFLVEKFNRILITQIGLPNFKRGITVFEEKADLLPFEEAKLYGHNATHALIGYLLRLKKAEFMAEAQKDKELMRLARDAFLLESGKALCKKYAGLDPLFTDKGYQAYVDDLLERMMNPHLRDSVERITRDPRRKLGWDDRLVGTMRLALSKDIVPTRYAAGAAAALRVLEAEEKKSKDQLFEEIWHDARAAKADLALVRKLIMEAGAALGN